MMERSEGYCEEEVLESYEISMATSSVPHQEENYRYLFHQQQLSWEETEIPQNPSFIFETPQNHTLETAFTRLDLNPSLTPPQQSSSVFSLFPTDLDGVFGGTTMGGSVMDPWIDPCFSYLHLQQMKQIDLEMQWLRYENAIMFQTIENIMTDRERDKLSPIRAYSSGNRFQQDSKSENSNVLMSALIDQYRNGFDYCYSLEVLRGRIMSVARDQDGCRFLQKKVEEGKPEDIELIFLEVKDHVGELMVDISGKYLVQKLIEVCNVNQRSKILISVTRDKSNLTRICLNERGTCAIQKLLAHLTTPQQISWFMSALLNCGIVILSKDEFGHKVIKHCLKNFSNEENKDLLNAVADHCFDIARDRYGCCVLKECMVHAHEELRERFMDEIITNALVLAEDSYGNYVVQELLEQRIPHVNADLLRQLEGSFVSLSKNKFGSHVVEKCLKELGEEQCTQIIRELISSTNFSMLLLNAYGNFVIQSALKVSEKQRWPIHQILANQIWPHYSSLNNHMYGRNILPMLKK